MADQGLQVGRPTVFDVLSTDFDVQSFDCGDDEIADYLKDKAIVDGHLRRTMTHVLHYAGDRRVLAFISTSMGQIKAVLDGQSERPIGALHIAYVGRHKLLKNNGWGKFTIAFAIDLALRLSKETGCRGVALNCYDHRVDFYKALGFKPYSSPKKDPDTQRMKHALFFDLLSAQKPQSS